MDLIYDEPHRTNKPREGHTMLNITRVNHIGIRVSDFDSAIAFYAKLGFEYLVGPVGPEPVAIVEHPCGININFILNADSSEKGNILMDVPVKHAGYTHMALEVEDMVVLVSELNEKSIAITEGPVTHPAGQSVFIRDQDMNVVEFYASTNG